jgi:hypothetical protein
METARAIVVPSSFCALKYAVSPITCPKRKLRNNIIHKIHGTKKIYVKIPKTTAITINVKVPIAVRKKLMKAGLASRSVFRKRTLETTKVKTAKIAIISPVI